MSLPGLPCWPQHWASCRFRHLCVSPQVLTLGSSLLTQDVSLPFFWDRTLCYLGFSNLGHPHPHLSSTCYSPIEKPAATRTHAMESGLWVSWHGLSFRIFVWIQHFQLQKREKERKKTSEFIFLLDLVEARASFQPHNLLSTQEEDTCISCYRGQGGGDCEVSISQEMESVSSGPSLVPRPFLGSPGWRERFLPDIPHASPYHTYRSCDLIFICERIWLPFCFLIIL